MYVCEVYDKYQDYMFIISEQANMSIWDILLKTEGTVTVASIKNIVSYDVTKCSRQVPAFWNNILPPYLWCRCRQQVLSNVGTSAKLYVNLLEDYNLDSMKKEWFSTSDIFLVFIYCIT
jgi:hypothetical protein